jgi:Na+/melibiose symporter-like transporter
LKKSFKDKFKEFEMSSRFIIKLAVVSLNWITNSVVYYGIMMNMGSLAGNPYITFIFFTILETLAVVLGNVVYHKAGRKMPYSIGLLIAGISLFSIQFVPEGIKHFLF